MGERKVIQKYYAPDFDPALVPKGKKVDRDAAKNIRLMLPFSLRCATCGHFMSAGKKFNAKKETAKGMDYLKIKRFRFRLKCESCKGRITFLTDPENNDYEMESGATRNYNLNREIKLSAAKEEADKEAEAEDSMQKLENRTLDSKRQMEVLDELDDIRRQNRARERVSTTDVLQNAHGSNTEDLAAAAAAVDAELDESREDVVVERAFAEKRNRVRRLEDRDGGNGDGDDVATRPLGRGSEADKTAEQNERQPDGATMDQVQVLKRRRKSKKHDKKLQKAKASKSAPRVLSLVGYASSDDE